MSIADKLNEVAAKIPLVYKAGYDKGKAEGGGSGGAGGTPIAVQKKDVNFYDYDGTRLYSYTIAEAKALTELPALPTRAGLICQGWNYDLATIKSYNRAVDVGATYITDDGKTRLYISIATEGKMTVPLYLSQTVENGVEIYWGDGSAKQTVSGTGNVSATHTYASIGDYVITLTVASACTLGFGWGTSNNCVIGGTSASKRVSCNMLQKIEIGDNVSHIGNYAFYYCYSLASITIPNGVATISNSAFHNCHSLASITIPNGVTSISNSAFYYCCSLASITIPNGVKSIGDSAFYNCYSLASITIPNGVTSIGSSKTFYNCYSLASITIPNGVTSIGGTAFSSCYSLASITIPDGVTSIGSNAFAYCYSLASITIPNGVATISGGAFASCNGMAIYDFTACTSVPSLENTNAFNSIPSDCVIKVPSSLLETWKAATNWSTYASQIVAG